MSKKVHRYGPSPFNQCQVARHKVPGTDCLALAYRPSSTRRLLNSVLISEAVWLSQQEPFLRMARAVLEALLQHKTVVQVQEGDQLSGSKDLIIVKQGSLTAGAATGQYYNHFLSSQLLGVSPAPICQESSSFS